MLIQLPELQRRTALLPFLVQLDCSILLLRLVLAFVRGGLSKVALTCDGDELSVSWAKERATNGVWDPNVSSSYLCSKDEERTRGDLERRDWLDVRSVEFRVEDRHQTVLRSLNVKLVLKSSEKVKTHLVSTREPGSRRIDMEAKSLVRIPRSPQPPSNLGEVPHVPDFDDIGETRSQVEQVRAWMESDLRRPKREVRAGVAPEGLGRERTLVMPPGSLDCKSPTIVFSSEDVSYSPIVPEKEPAARSPERSGEKARVEMIPVTAELVSPGAGKRRNLPTLLSKSAAARWRGMESEARASRSADVQDLNRVFESTVKAVNGLASELAG